MKLTFEITGITGSVIRTKTLDPLVVIVTQDEEDWDLGKGKIEEYLSKKFLMADKIVLTKVEF